MAAPTIEEQVSELVQAWAFCLCYEFFHDPGPLGMFSFEIMQHILAANTPLRRSIFPTARAG